MSAILYRKNETGEIVSERVNPLRVANLLDNGFKSDPNDFNEPVAEQKELIEEVKEKPKKTTKKKG